MKIAVTQSDGGTGLFSAGAQTTIRVTADANEAASATAAVSGLLGALGAARSAEAVAYVETDEEPEEPADVAPGDAVRITFEDGTSRLFIYTGNDYRAPVVLGRFDEPMVRRKGDVSIQHVVVVAQEVRE